MVRSEPVGCAAHTEQHNLLVHHAVLGAVTTDHLYEEVGIKGQKEKNAKQLRVSEVNFCLCFQHDKNNAKQ
jgi:hypothetical protein